MRGRRLKLLVAAVACSAMVHAPLALSQSFLDQFYQDLVQAANVTAPDIYRSADSHTVFGGSVAMRLPQRQFRPLYFTPYNLRGGCGGIDMMMGAFSVPSREEFVNFLRSIGQNLAGLAFQLALSTLSAQLESKVGEYKKMLMDLSSWSIDSCKAAEAIRDWGMKWLRESADETIGEQRASGSCSDQAECKTRYETNAERVIDECGPERLSDGSEVPSKCQSNVTWDLLRAESSTNWMTREVRELIMALVGSVIFRAEEPNGQKTLVTTPLPPVQNVTVANLIREGVSRSYSCDEGAKCLRPREVLFVQPVSLQGRVRDIAERYVKGILERAPRHLAGVQDDEIVLLGGMTAMPVLAILNTVAHPTASGIRGNVLDVVATTVAVEIVSVAFDTLLREAQKAAAGTTSSANRQQAVEVARYIEGRIQNLREQLRAERSRAVEDVRRLSDYVVILDHLNRAWRSRMSAELAANLNFGRR